MSAEIVYIVDFSIMEFPDDIRLEWDIKLASLSNLSEDAVPKFRIYPDKNGEIFIYHNGNEITMPVPKEKWTWNGISTERQQVQFVMSKWQLEQMHSLHFGTVKAGVQPI